MTVRRVVLATDAVGGVWTYSVELARALREFGVEAVLTAMGPSPSADQISDADGLRVIDTGLPLDWLAEHPRDVRGAGDELARLAASEGGEIVQLHSAALACDAAFDAPVVAVQHSCVATWWDSVRGGPLPPDFAWRRDMVECGLKRADAVVAPTLAFAAQVERTYGLRRVNAVHNGRRSIALPERPQADFVLTVGRLWDDGKNVRTLDAAAALLDVAVEAIGPVRGPDGTAAGFEHLRMPGPLGGEALAERLGARPIFASSALYEPFGLSALEAAQAGCALVLSDIATFRELWSGAAIFVEPRNAEAFARAVSELLQDSEMRERLGRAAQRRALTYAPGAMAARMVQIYEQVVASHDRVAEPLACAGAA